jgi:triosephosphate isomerase
MRRKIVAANWKMNMSTEDGIVFFQQLRQLPWPKDVDAIVAPPSLYLQKLFEVKGHAELSGQNCHSEQQGAFTGEVSATMLTDVGAQYCIVGHSERRKYFEESSSFLKAKVNALLENGLSPIYCCGETESERQTGAHFETVKNQLTAELFALDSSSFENVIIAYEPVWAIGTGLTATAAQAQEMHSFIRSVVETNYGREIAEKMCVLYGGSCNPSNAKELFQCEDVDGGLIGGASMDPSSFLQIAQSFQE